MKLIVRTFVHSRLSTQSIGETFSISSSEVRNCSIYWNQSKPKPKPKWDGVKIYFCLHIHVFASNLNVVNDVRKLTFIFVHPNSTFIMSWNSNITCIKLGTRSIGRNNLIFVSFLLSLLWYSYHLNCTMVRQLYWVDNSI